VRLDYQDITHDIETTMRKYAIIPHDSISYRFDGKHHRFRIAGKDSSSKDGAYLLNDDGVSIHGYFQDHSNGQGTISYCYRYGKKVHEMAHSERLKYEEQKQLNKKKTEQETKRKNEKTAHKAKRMWQAGNPTIPEILRGYAHRKGIWTQNLKLLCEWHTGYWDEKNLWQKVIVKNVLLVPIFDEKGDLVNLQALFPQKNEQLGRDKDFLSGGQKKGCWHVIEKGGDFSCLVIAEGYATGMSIHMATGYPVIVSFDAGNMVAVAPLIRVKYPTATIFIAEDWDEPKEEAEGTGQRKAREASKACGGIVVKTGFTTKGDFNDLHTQQGVEAVKACFEKALTEQLTQKDTTRKEGVSMNDENQDIYQDHSLMEDMIYNQDMQHHITTNSVETPTVIPHNQQETEDHDTPERLTFLIQEALSTDEIYSEIAKKIRKTKMLALERDSLAKTIQKKIKNLTDQNPKIDDIRKLIAKEITSDSSLLGFKSHLGDTGIKNGLYYYSEDINGDITNVYVSSYIKHVGYANTPTEKQEGDGWYLYLKIQDADGKVREGFALKSLLAGNGEKLREYLLEHYAVRIDDERLLKKYLMESHSNERIWITPKTGWHDENNVYIFPNGQTIGEIKNSLYSEIKLQLEQKSSHGKKGTLRDWQQYIAYYCIGNSRLVFAVSASFGSCLLSLLGLEARGFHNRGKSSIGKSICLFVGGSVYGGEGFVKNWSMTEVGIELTAQTYNDCFLPIDEIGQANADKIGNIVYMLGNGQGKGRGKANVTMRDTLTFRLIFMSSGETSLNDHMKTKNKQSTAGMEVRIIDIPADAGKGMGIFENIYQFSNLSDDLKKNCSQFAKTIMSSSQNYYGTAGNEFISSLIKHKDGLKERFRKYVEYFTNTYIPKGSDGQVYRVAESFALVGFAGELATEWNITEWPKGEATRATVSCFNAYIENRGGTGSIEKERILEAVRGFIGLHGKSRFQQWSGENKYFIQNRIGFVKNGTDNQIESYYILKDTFSEVCKGFDANLVLNVLRDEEILVLSSQGYKLRSERLPEINKASCYVLNAQKLFAPVEINPQSSNVYDLEEYAEGKGKRSN
jgi:uncharacterized protein (DUF927 family)/phage/plasmid primase-like uncharacterized protein